MKQRFSSVWNSNKMRYSRIVIVVLAIALSCMFALAGCKVKGDKNDSSTSDGNSTVQTTYCTVTFDSNGGSLVSSATVKSGETVSEPTSPVRANYVFVGWYEDSAYENRFVFDSQPVTENIKLYARWEQSLEYEYTVVFDLNYDDLEPSTASTLGGRLYDLPQPQREGYDFNGWWVSMYNDPEMLSYEYEAEMEIYENVSLYALWVSNEASDKLSAPIVTVEGDYVVWTGDEKTTRYNVEISGPEGFEDVSRSTGDRRFDADFTKAPAGDYVIKVTATSSQSSNNSDTTVRYYKNKALAAVSVFEVKGESLLMFNNVANAENYLISIDCGTPNHEHVDYDNGNSTSYDFANCDMKTDGMVFTVKAVAEGYVTSSSSYCLNRSLSEVSGLKVNETTAEVSWNAVDKAKEYVVTVTDGDTTTTATVTGTMYSMNTYSEGKYTVSVYPKGKLYNSPEATVVTYSKNTIAAPADVTISGNTVTWTAVEGASKYVVKVDGKTYTVNGTSLNLQKGEHYSGDKGTCSVSVQSVSSKSSVGDSAYSNVVTARFGSSFVENLAYNSGVVTWDPVLNAQKYEVKVNEGAGYEVEGNQNTAEITFTNSGVNTVSVRYYDYNGKASEWANLDVRVYEITFETNGGDRIDAMYLAAGDVLNLPEAIRSGYVMTGWYNSADGSASGSQFVNGTAFAGRNTTLYATWKGKTYTITYNYGDKDVYGNDHTAEAVYHEEYVWDSPVSTDGAVQFIGWYSQPFGDGVKYTDFRGVGYDAWSTPANTTVYAYWATVFEFTLRPDGTYAVAKGPELKSTLELSEITIPATYKGIDVTAVSAYAFESCSSLSVINIPDTIEVIETDTAFYRCKNIEEVNVYNVDPNANYERLWSSTDGVLVFKDNVQGEYLLKYIPVVKKGSFEIPKGVTAIPLKVFSATLISEIIIPSTVTLIEESAFFNCALLTSVVFAPVEEGEEAKGLTIRDLAFQNCTSLSSVTFPARLEEISTGMFSGCNLLADINIEEGGTAYSSKEGSLCSIDGKELVLVPVAKYGDNGIFTIPNGVTKIGENAFGGCYRIREVVIPGVVLSIGDYAFANLPELTKVTFQGIGYEARSIGDYAFYNCKKLSMANFEEECNVTTVGEYAFANTAITNLYIPKNMTTVSDYAFADCINLNSVSFAENGENINFGSYVFLNCLGLTEVYLPASVESFAQAAFEGCSNLSNIFVDKNSTHYMDKDGVLFTKDETTLVFYPIGRKGEYVIPESVTTIADRVFKDNQNITGIIIGLNITNIGANAFDGCFNLTNLTIVDYTYDENGNIVDDTFEKLTIEDSAFANCIRLESVKLPSRVTEIVPYLFNGSSALKAVEIDGAIKVVGKYSFANTAITELNLPETVTTLGEYAFAGAELTNIVLPANITSIGKYVFNGCRYLDTVSFAAGSVIKTIPQYAFASSTVREVAIPASVTKIDNYAFDGASLLEKVNFEDGSKLSTIGAYAFRKCYALNNFVLQDTVTSIGNYAFRETSNLTNFTVGANSKLQTVGTYAFYYSGIEEFFVPKTVTSLGNYSFAYTSNLNEMNFATDGTKDLTIGTHVYYFSNIPVLNFPARLKTITASSNNYFNNVFRNAKKLTAVNIDANCATYTSVDGIVYSKDMTMLWYCPEGKQGNVFIPNTVSVVKDYAFYQCAFIKKVTFEEADEGMDAALSIGASSGYVFQYASLLEEVELPNHLTNIGKYAFGYCLNLKHVDIPASVVKLDNGVFMYSGLESYTFEKYADGSRDLTTINGTAFGYSNLTYALIPKEITVLNSQVYAYNYNLKKVEFEEGAQITEIGQAFTKTAIEEFTIPEGVEVVKNYCFLNTPLTKISLPSTLTNIFTAVMDLPLTHIDIADAHPDYKDIDGVIYNKSGDLFVFMPAGRTGHYDVIPGTVTIGEDAFRSSVLTSVNVPSSVVRIESAGFSFADIQYLTIEDGEDDLVAANAFTTMGLKEITIPKRVTDIGNRGFENCYYLEKVVFAENSRITVLGERVFQNCSSMTTVVLPEYLENIGPCFNFCGSLTTLVFPDTITEIPGEICSRCDNLNTVVLPKNLTSIGEYAFENCNISSIDLPASVVSIGEGAFMGNVNLTNFNIAEGCALTQIEANTFAGCAFTEFAIPETVTYIGDNAFGVVTKDVEDVEVEFACSNLTTINIPAGVTYIGDNAFNGAVNLTGLDLPATLTEIGDYAFYNCRSIERATIPGTVADVGSYAFAGCTALSELFIREGVLTLGSGAFENCKSITELYIPGSLIGVSGNPFAGCSGLEAPEISESNTVMMYENGALYDLDRTILFAYLGDGTEEFVIPEGVSFIAPGAFSNTPVTSVVFNDLVKEVPADAFKNATSLSNVTLTENILTIGANAFQGCTALENFDLPKSLKTIDTYAFEGSGITSVVIGPYVTMVGTYAFANCESLETLDFDNNGMEILTLSDYAFYDCDNLTDVTLARRVSVRYKLNKAGNKYTSSTPAIGKYCFANCENLTNLNFDQTGSKKQGGATFCLTLGANAFENCSSLLKVNFPSYFGPIAPNDGITSSTTPASFGTSAFANCTSLEEVTFINPRFTSFGSYIFENCSSLKTFEFPTTVTSIGTRMFNNCTSLTEVKLPPYFTSVPDYAFCNTQITEIELPDAVTTIGSYAFYNTKLVSVVVPSKVTTIKDYAFAECKELTSVDLPVGLKQLGKFSSGTIQNTWGYVFANCTNIAEISIPYTVSSCQTGTFLGWTEDQVIKVQYLSQPLKNWYWDEGDWDVGCNATIVWGYDPMA